MNAIERGRRTHRGSAALRLLPLVIALGAIALLASATAPKSRAADGATLVWTGTTTYDAQPDLQKVHVTILVTATPQIPAGSKASVDSLEIAVPASSSRFAATADGRPLGTSVRRPTPNDALVRVAFGRALRPPDTISFSLEFDIVDLSTATDRDLRISPTLMSFPVWAFGSAGTQSGVSVVLPAGYDVSFEAGQLDRTTDSQGAIVLSSGVLSDPGRFLVWITAQRWPQYTERALDIAGMSITLRYWSDDPGWALAVGQLLERAYPVMHGLVGDIPPTVPQLVVEESTSRDTRGYGGIFDPDAGIVRVSYLADPFLVLHELGHLWFNRTVVGERWIEEAFASYYAELTGEDLGLQLRLPRLSPALSGAAIPLDTWVGPGDSASLQEDYGYAATLEVATEIDALSPAIPNVLRGIWRDVATGRAAYQRPNGPKNAVRSSQPLRWRELLDYLEERTSLSFDDIWRSWIVTSAERPELEVRDAVRATYDSVETLAEPWKLPPEISRALGAWRLSDADGLLHRAEALLDERDSLTAEAAAQATAVPARLQAAFEQSLASGESEAVAEQHALAAIAAAAQAEAKSRDPVGKIALVGSDPVAELAAARAAFASGDVDRATQLANQASDAWTGADAGRDRLVAAVVAAALVVSCGLAAFYFRRNRRTGSRAAERAGHAPTAAEATADTTVSGDTSLRPVAARGPTDAADQSIRRLPRG